VEARPESGEGRAGAWIDLAAFAGGLGLAWFAKWQARDLIWSLWLSSLVVGYAAIVWTLLGGLRAFAGNAVRDRTAGGTLPKLAAGGLIGGGFLFGLGFFTVHFGGFHFVHSVFLQIFFPLQTEAGVERTLPDWGLYAEVVRNYWMFLPLAFLAEREAFGRKERHETSDTAVTAEAIARRKSETMKSPLMAPYRNVVRLHLLIFFFAGAIWLKLDHFAIYAVVYAVYFFPWRWAREKWG